MASHVIAIEGIDGTGKTGVIDYLKNSFRGWVYTREPSDKGYRELIKGSINSGDEILLALLFAADHRYHIENVIKPAKLVGLTIISDRYLHSHLAYQSATLADTPLEFHEDWLCNIYSDWIELPDLVIHLTASPKTCEARIRGSRTQVDNYEKAEFLARVESYYQEYYRRTKYAVPVRKIQTENKSIQKVCLEVVATIARELSGEHHD